MEPTIDEARIYSELKELGIEPNQVSAFQKSGDKDSIISVVAPANFLQDSKAIIQIDFSASPKENKSEPAIDFMVATVHEPFPSGETVQLMHQTFFREYGDFPSLTNLQRRAYDHIHLNTNARVEIPKDANERIKYEFSNLELNYADFGECLVNKDTIIATNVFPIDSLNERDNYLVVDVILKKQDKENEYGIYAVAAELRQWSNEQPTILWKEIQINDRDTLPKLTHLYSRALETLSELTRKVAKNKQQDELPQQNTRFQLPEVTKKIMDRIQNNHVNGKQQKPKV
jgi:hypothetical protein